MSVITKNEIEKMMLHENLDKKLIITPFLDKEKQIGAVTIDLRLGTKFKVDMRTREPYIDSSYNKRPIQTFFDETYRDIGNRFILYPNQLVIASTLEYVKIPNNVFGTLYTRSSWNRLGLKISSIVQSGYAGVLTLELLNNSSNPIALYPGMRFVQLILNTIDGEAESSYISNSLSKYIANIEPQISNLTSDDELKFIQDTFSMNNF